LEEVIETWADEPFDELDPPYRLREILLIEDEMSPDLDELLLQLRAEWMLELNIDPESNVDDAGRELGHTLWHAIAMAEPAAAKEQDGGAYITVWATASCLDDAVSLVEKSVEEAGSWVMSGMYSIERVAFDERPEELASLALPREESEIHLIAVDAWGGAKPPAGPSEYEDDEDDFDSLGGRLSS
jgi:hypothetical protein